MSVDVTTHLDNRPKRADARRNYDKLVAAAREAFTEADRSASLEDIARRAGVGIGTLYRNFPTRSDLVLAVYVDEVLALSRVAEELVAADDAWDALSGWVARFVEYVTTKQALAEELFAAGQEAKEVFAGCRSALYAAGEPLLGRAQDEGIVRGDVTIGELIQLIVGIAKIPSAPPEQVQRILAVALDGLRYRG